MELNNNNSQTELVAEDTLEKKALIVCTGVLPIELKSFCALAIKLRSHGWSVGVVTHECYLPYVKAVGQFAEDTCFGVSGNPETVFETPQLRTAMATNSVIRQITSISDEFTKLYISNIAENSQAIETFAPTLIVAALNNVSESLAMCQLKNIPLAIVSSYPYNETKSIPPIGTLKEASTWNFINKGLYYVTKSAIWLNISDAVNKLRTQKGLQAQSQYIIDGLPMLNCYSELAFPAPLDWPKATTITGYWSLPPDPNPDHHLQQFVSAKGEKPIAFVLLSFPLFDVAKTLAAITEAIQQLSKRAVVVIKKYPELDSHQWPEHIFCTHDCDLDFLFSHCSLLVHHGSGSVSGAAFRAGIPAVSFPFCQDQPFWTSRAGILGVGPKAPIELKTLSAGALTKAINECEDIRIVESAKGLAQRLNSEDGAEVALKTLEQIFRTKRGTGRTFQWQKDSQAPKCNSCSQEFTFFVRRHHCRYCGLIFCLNCLALRDIPNYPKEQMICRNCWDERSTVEGTPQSGDSNATWQELQTEKGEKYYWNKKENKVTWSADQFLKEKTDSEPRPFPKVKAPPKDSTHTFSETKPTGEEWEEYQTETGDAYYYNRRLNTTTWTNKKLEEAMKNNPVLQKAPPPEIRNEAVPEDSQTQDSQEQLIDNQDE